jgi:hypothetical protein
MKNLKIKIFKIIVVLAMFYVFFMNASWYSAKPVSSMSEYILERNPNIPQEANYFATNHGKAIFFIDSKKENPLRFYGTITFLILCWAFLIISSKDSLGWFKYKKRTD